MSWNAEEIMQEMDRVMTARVTSACIYLVGDVKTVLSVPAPRVRVKSKLGVIYYRATVRATPGAPPRKLSGNLRRKISWEVHKVNGEIIGRVGTNVKYARRLEKDTGHAYLAPTLEKRRPQILAILKG